jgi:hypothetical protein
MHIHPESMHSLSNPKKASDGQETSISRKNQSPDLHDGDQEDNVSVQIEQESIDSISIPEKTNFGEGTSIRDEIQSPD